MNSTWQSIADLLRTELAEHGALLQLYNDQQECLFARDAEGVTHYSDAIKEQVDHLQARRQDRETAIADFARQHGQPETSSLRSLLPFIEADARPLIEALINEVNHLIHRVRRAGRHNHHLLARTVALHRDTLRQLRPSSFNQTYAPNGQLSMSGGGAIRTLSASR